MLGSACGSCPLRAQGTKSSEGRNVNVHPQEWALPRERERQKAGWKAGHSRT